jgi:putative transposase
MHTMTKRQGKSGTIDVKALLREDEEFLRALVRTALQEVLEAEITRVGKLELRVPQDRTGRFSTELFERYQRSERALVAALAEMYVQGVSTCKSLPSRRRVKAITEELCGHSFSASSISAMNPGAGCEFGAICRSPVGRSLPLSDPRRALMSGCARPA